MKSPHLEIHQFLELREHRRWVLERGVGYSAVGDAPSPFALNLRVVRILGGHFVESLEYNL